MKSRVVFWMLFLLLTGSISAQDIHFSQFYESPLTLNPALCGMYPGQYRVELNYKNQWGSVLGSGYGFNTVAASVEFHNIMKKWKNSYLSPGLSVFSDKSGDAKVGTTEVNLTLASGVKVDAYNTIAVGLQAGWSQSSINTSSLQWGTQYNANSATGYDPDLPPDPIEGNSFSYLDFSGGAAWNYATSNTNITSNNYLRINAGAAVYHVNQPNQSFYGDYDPSSAGVKLYMRWVGHALVDFNIPNTNFGFIPAIVYYLQGPATELDMGVKVRYVLKQDSKYTGLVKAAAIDIGGYYRLGDAVIPTLQIEFGKYAIGMSYDINVSYLDKATYGAGGAEIFLRFLNPNPKERGAAADTHTMF